MYRTLLTATFVGLLALALAAAGLAYWTASEARHQLERTRLAREVLEGHLRLKADIYALVKQLSDNFLSNGGDRDEPRARQEVRDEVEGLRRRIAQEVAVAEYPLAEAEELLRLAAIERLIETVLAEFDRARELLREGRSEDARSALNATLEHTIDQHLRTRIDEAVADEHEEVMRAHADAEAALGRASILSQLDAAAALALFIGALAVLLRRLQRPLDQLAAAANAIAAGDLSRRVATGGGRDEFARVAESFNAMVDEVERSRRELEASREGLERAVAQRTTDLRAANERLKQADETRRRFLADISHELRTPITVIRGEAEVTLRGKSTAQDEYKTTLARIIDSAGLMAHLVEDLLFVARAEAGVPRITRQAVAFDSVVRRACADAVVIAEPKELRIELTEHARGLVVQGDSRRLRQLLLILLDNAARYSPRAGVVRVDLSQDADSLVLTVADNGVGIAEDEVGRIFERFYRSENAAEYFPEGSGLGLPVAKAIADAHDGEIAIQSALGQGTTVRVRLPTVRKIGAVA